MNKTQEILFSMLKENIGSSMCDSGGTPQYDNNGNYKNSIQGYGRAYEQNQKRKFIDEPQTILSFSNEQISITHNTFHFLNNILEYCPKYQRLFNYWVNKKENKNENWLTLMEKFKDYLQEKGYEVTGLYGRNEPITENTYNHESLLSQVLQYTYMEVNQEPIILLQIHGGCDVRGGYTKPKVFFLKGETEIFHDENATIYCHNCGKYWDTDDGYNFYDEGSTKETNLKDYEFIEVEGEPDKLIKSPSLFDKDKMVLAGHYEHKGKLAYDKDDNGYCPNCGGQLEAGY